MPSVDIRGNAIHYELAGSPELPPLVLLHGLYGNGLTVERLAHRLSERFHVISPDALGHGQSVRPEHFTLADQGLMHGELVTRLGHDSAAFVGISMGSYLAAQTAILAPERVSRLVLVVSKAHGTSSSVAAYAARNGIDLGSLAPEQLVEVMGEALWSPSTSAERRAAFYADAPVQTPLTAAEQAKVEESLAGFDLRPRLGEIVAPTLVISGRSDGLNPPSSGQEVAEGIPGATFVVYEDSGHMLSYEEEERLVADVTAFLDPAD